MKKPTIWESATRPLFVRSVWLESDGGHRHFLLDYEPQQRRYSDTNVKPKRDNLRQTQSYDYQECDISDDDDDDDDTLQLIGLQKEQFQPFQQTKIQIKPIISTQKTSLNTKSVFDIFRRRPYSGYYSNGGDIFKNEPPSKMSSLQDINSTLSHISNSDERLAERVLNWLDLAGKNPLIQTSNSFEKNVKKNTARISTSAKKNKINNHQNQTSGYKNYQSNTEKRPDSVKHITIVFNKEGIPIRYNRPVRYSDLFRSGYSGPRKYGYGSFSANGYTRLNHIENIGPSTAVFDKAALDLKKPHVRTSSVRKNYENDYRTVGVNRKIVDNSCSIRDVKKQLHIFMPNLPKKSNLIVADDMTSNISASINDLKGNDVVCNN